MKELLTRRNILIGAGGAAIVAGGAYVASRGKRHAASPYDDLLAKLDDRDGGVAVGQAVLAEGGEFDTKAVAMKLRARFAHATLPQTVTGDAAGRHLLEAHGWVLPESLAQLCALAASV